MEIITSVNPLENNLNPSIFRQIDFRKIIMDNKRGIAVLLISTGKELFWDKKWNIVNSTVVLVEVLKIIRLITYIITNKIMENIMDVLVGDYQNHCR